MRAVWIEPDEQYLAERRRLGHDKKDELWDGVLHLVPPPSYAHDHMTFELIFALKPVVDRLGLVVLGATTGMFGSEKNYRIPDVIIGRADQTSERGFEGAELVVEVLSPNDESRDKFPFYASRGIREYWLVHPITRAVEMYELANGAYVRMTELRSRVLGITLEVSDTLRVIDGARVVEI